MNIGVEIKLKTDFLIVKEILSRIGIADKNNKIIYPSCYLLHKKNKYYIVHFKEMFVLDGKNTDITEQDLNRRDSVVFLLSKWDNIIEPVIGTYEDYKTDEFLFVLKKNQMLSENWRIQHKYQLGKFSKNKE